MVILLNKFSVDELETLCEPTYEADKNKPEEAAVVENAQEQKKIIAKSLIPIFKEGRKDVARDEWKAAKYQQISAHDVIETPDTPVRTATLFDFHGLLNSFRLFLVRIHRFFVVAGVVILPRLFALWGLSCALTLLADIVIVFKNTFIDDLQIKNKIKLAKDSNASFGFFQKLKLALGEIGSNPSRYLRDAGYRFKNSMLKDNRPPRMLNDALWFGINLTVFLVTGPIGAALINPLLNLIGFTFDAGISGFLTGKRYVHMTNIIDKLNAQITAFRALKNTPENQKSINTLSFMVVKMKEKRTENMNERIRNTIFLSLVLVGMVLIFAFPPATAPAGFIIGSVLALGFGTATGFYPKAKNWAKKIYNHGKDFFTRTPQNRRRIQISHSASDQEHQSLLAAEINKIQTQSAVAPSPSTQPPFRSTTAHTIVQLEEAAPIVPLQPIKFELVTTSGAGSDISRPGSEGSDPASSSSASRTPPTDALRSLVASTTECCTDPDDELNRSNVNIRKVNSVAMDLTKHGSLMTSGMRLNHVN